MMGGNLDMKLSPTENDMLRGPLTIKSGDETVISAQVGLKVQKEIFALLLEIASPEDPTLVSRASIQVTGKREDWSGNIEAPKNAQSFQEFADKVSAVMPLIEEGPLE
jgi:hypothetical protein